MKRLEIFVNESEGFHTTDEWLRKMYAEYNEKLFKDELPKNIELRVVNESGMRSLGMAGKDTVGVFTYKKRPGLVYVQPKWQGFKMVERGHYALENDMYVLTIDHNEKVSDIMKLEPVIAMNTYFDNLNELQHEDTLIHEMIHLWVEKDGLCPKRAHGKEFKAKCREVRALAKDIYGKTYWLDTYCDVDSATPEETEKKKADEKLDDLDFKVVCLAVVMRDNSIRYVWTTQNKSFSVRSLILEKEGPENVKGIVKLKRIYKFASGLYGNFKMSYKYNGYLPAEKYPKITEWMKEKLASNSTDFFGDASVMYAENRSVLFEALGVDRSVHESKEKYESPMAEIIQLPDGVNMSTFDAEEFIKSLEEEIHIKPSAKNEANFIEVK